MSENETVFYYFAGAPYRAGSMIPSNVTGECPHRHRTPEAAAACIARTSRSIKRGHGQDAYCDRTVMVATSNGARVYDGSP